MPSCAVVGCCPTLLVSPAFRSRPPVRHILWQDQAHGRHDARPCRPSVAAYGLFGSLFDRSAPLSPLADYSSESLDEVVLRKFTQSDGTVYNVVFRKGGPVDLDDLEQLCAKVGWPPRPSAKVRIALANSFMVGTLTLEAPDPGSPAAPPPRLVGLARATSDGVFNATLWDVAVDPDLQNLGLGKALVETMVRALLRLDITNVTLFADAHTISFYSALGFQPDPQGIKGMFWYPRY
ncbi:hypothetical protein ACKKBG_A07530 [Auxenochlorella protothecoides x Auxenochlorella symbiontica]